MPEAAALRRPFPVFVVGTARSGTTLTYSLLLASGEFPVYEAESRLIECESRYGSLRSAKNRRRFLGDFLNSRQFARSGLSKAELVELVERQPGSYIELLDSFMTAICRLQGKTRWVEKSPNNAHFVRALAAYYPDARFVHVVRDGRAVVTSQRHLGFGNPYTSDPRRQLIWIGNVWDYQVENGLKGAELGPARYLEVRYENLVNDLPGSLERLGRFAGVEIDVSKVSSSQVGALGTSNTAFEMPRGGVSSGSLDQWRSVLRPDEVSLLNWQLGDRLEELGYELGEDDDSGVTVGDRFTNTVSRAALRWKHRLNLGTPVGRIAQKPLELGLT